MTDDGKMFFGPRDQGPAPADLTGQLNDLVNRALENETERQRPRGYLGGSRVGLECHRQLAYEYFRSVNDKRLYDEAKYNFECEIPDNPFDHRTPHNFDGAILRRFALGHILEDETARLLRLAGFTLRTEKAGGSQFGWGTAEDPETGEQRMKGHADGIMDNGPIVLPYPLLWENKMMKDKKWRETKKRGVQKVYPVYYGQMQTYMAYMNLLNALFTAYNSDTSDLHVELIPFDALHAQHCTDRAVRVLQAERPEDLPRHTKDEAHYLCKWCDFNELCWTPPERIFKTDQDLPPWIAGE
jgi:hypothetical protein